MRHLKIESADTFLLDCIQTFTDNSYVIFNSKEIYCLTDKDYKLIQNVIADDKNHHTIELIKESE